MLGLDGSLGGKPDSKAGFTGLLGDEGGSCDRTVGLTGLVGLIGILGGN